MVTGAHGLDVELRIPADLGIVGFVAQTLTTINVQDAVLDKRFDASTDKMPAIKQNQFLAMPLYI